MEEGRGGADEGRKSWEKQPRRSRGAADGNTDRIRLDYRGLTKPRPPVSEFKRLPRRYSVCRSLSYTVQEISFHDVRLIQFVHFHGLSFSLVGNYSSI